MHSKMSGKWRPSCRGLNALIVHFNCPDASDFIFLSLYHSNFIRWINNTGSRSSYLIKEALVNGNNFETHINDRYPRHFPWNYPQVNVTRPRWLSIKIGSGNGFVLVIWDFESGRSLWRHFDGSTLYKIACVQKYGFGVVWYALLVGGLSHFSCGWHKLINLREMIPRLGDCDIQIKGWTCNSCATGS